MSNTFFSKGNQAFRNDKYQEALKNYLLAKKENPEFSKFVDTNIALIKRRAPDLLQQITLHQENVTPTIDYQNKTINQIIQLAQEAMGQDDWVAAYHCWNSLLGRTDEALSVPMLLRISKELFALDAFSEAEAALQRAEKCDPKHPGVLTTRAQQYYYHCYSSWLMLVTENEPDWYKADGLDKRPDWRTACELIERAEKAAPRNNLRRYVQAYLLLAEEAWGQQQPTQACEALGIALKAIGPNALDKSLTQAIFAAVEQFRTRDNEQDPYHQALQDHLQALPLELLAVPDWLCLNDILNWNGLLLCGYVAREKAVDLAIAQGKANPEHKEILKTALKAALDRGDTALSDEFLSRLKAMHPDALDVRELDSCSELMKGNLDAFRAKWPHSLTPAQQRLRDYLKGKSVAVVGPAPTGTMDGEEIDSFDVVVRMNWRGKENMPDAKEFGKRTDISLYNAHTARLLNNTENLIQNSNLKFYCIRRTMYEKKLFSLDCIDIVHNFEYPCVFYKSVNAIQCMIFSLVLLEADCIKLFKIDFYSAKKYYSNNYRGNCFNRNFPGVLRFLQPIMANHDFVTQLNIINTFAQKIEIYKLSISISHLLFIGIYGYLKQMQINIYDEFYEKIEEYLPSLKLGEDIKKLQAKDKLNISIVGNSPIIINSNLGESIDSADIVIRINNYATINYESDVGKKTDFVMITPAIMPNPELMKIPGHRIIAFCNDKFEYLNTAQARMNLENGCKIDLSKINIIDLGLVRDLIAILRLEDRQWPSTGLLAIAWCINTFKSIDVNINLFGFSFFKESGNRLQHYYGIETKRDKHHNFDSEEKFVLNLQEKGHVNLVADKTNLSKIISPKYISSKKDPDIVIASHYEESRSSSPCVSVYYGILNNKDYCGEVSHLYTRSTRTEYENSLDKLLRKKRLFLFNGICSYLQDTWVVDSFEKIFASGSIVGVYWHETAWNINKFRKTWQKNWDKSIDFFKKFNCFHLVPTSQNKQLVMLLTEADIERIRVIFETIPDTGFVGKQRGNSQGILRIVGAGVPDKRKGFDIFKQLSLDPDLLGFQFIWHWHENIDKVKQRFDGIGRVEYRRYVEDFGEHLKMNADLFLLTSRDDPSPIVALEALRSDVPVICFDSTGYVEVLPKEFISNSYSDMKQKILDFSSHLSNYEPGAFYKLFQDHTPSRFLEKANLSDFY